MLQHYLKLSNHKRSHYISWNILFLWGFGLWIALCTSNISYPDVLMQEATLFYQQNWNSTTAYNIATKAETMEAILDVTPTNYTLCNIILMLRTMLYSVHVFIFMCFMMLFVCVHEHVRKKITVWNNRIHDSYLIGSYLKAVVNYHRKHDVSNKRITCKNDRILFQSKLIINCGISAEHLQKTYNFKQKEDKYILEEDRIKNIFDTNINTVQHEISFSSYTLLLFDNNELYHYYTNQQLKHTFNFSQTSLMVQGSQCTEGESKFLNNYQGNRDNKFKKSIQKCIISSSPEFQKFLANLKKSEFLYPCMLEISTSCVVRIKSTYK